MKRLLFGWAEVNLTPDKPMALDGQFAERISQYVEKPLTATAFAVSSDNEQMILVSCDLSATPWNLLETVRERVKEHASDIDTEKIVLNAIHTHTGPVFPVKKRCELAPKAAAELIQDFLPKDKKYVERVCLTGSPELISPQETFELLVDRITEAIQKAWNNRKEGAFCNAFGRAAVGMCRRVVYSDGSAKMWGDTNTATFREVEGGSDTGIELLYVFDSNRKLTGIVANVACPAQCVQHRLFVSPDYWGEVKLLLREEFGEHIFLLPLCSAAGDQCPIDLVRWVEPESELNDPNIERENPLKRKADPSMFDLAGLKRAGRRIAREIIDVYQDGLDEAVCETHFEHLVHTAQLPLRRVTLSEAETARKAIHDYIREKVGDVNYEDAAKLYKHMGILARFELQEQVDVLDEEIHVIRLGSIAIATNPFELFLDYGNQIRARSHAEQTFLIQLANGCEGYLPTEKAERGGHYSAFVASGQVGHEGGDLLVRETLRMINRELFPK